jgi:GDP-4-dehydro-6-deoxy-D-mannose reductase
MIMKRALITGITGFAGSHLAEALVKQGTWEVFGIHASDRHLQNIESIKDNVTLQKVNLLDGPETNRVIAEVKPDVIFHLAASTFVGDSFDNPAEFISNNAASQVNVLEAVRANNLTETKIIVVSSANIYGLVDPNDLPINEKVQFNPDNPYAVSKITQDYLGLSYYLSYNLPIIRVRPFNHIGSRLPASISISRFAKQIAEIEKGLQEPIMKVGNLEAKRDFTDVSDMVRAYMLAAEKGKNGEAYNLGTGVSHKIGDVLEKLISLSTVSIRVESDQSLFRPSDIPDLRCDASKFKSATGWEPIVPLEKSLQDILDYWRHIV